MKFFVFLLSIIIITSCSTKPRFPNKEVCFLLYDLETKKFEEIFNSPQCEIRLPPASTFKVPLAVMAFDAEILKDENHTLKWDGKKRMLESWNKDQTATSWMRESVVWYSQELTPLLGKSKIEYYLKTFRYGNADMTAGLKESWLTNSPSLKISGMEQVFFLEKLWRGELKASARAQQLTRKLLVHEFSPSASELTGKTGSGYIGDQHDLRLGWYVGHLRVKNKEYIVVMNFTDIVKEKENIFGGMEAKELVKKILTKKKLW